MRSDLDRRRGWRVLPLLRLASALALISLSAGARPAPAAPAENPAYRYCPVCGAQNRVENRFCLRDGTPLSTLQALSTRRGGEVVSDGDF